MALDNEALKQFWDFAQKQGSLQKKDYGVAGSVLGGLGALYNGNQAIDVSDSYLDSLSQNQQQIQQRMNSMPTLDAMYGQNSPFSVQLQETLARKDAAAGRNSQYGNRAVQLQAALADKGSTYAAQQAQVAEMLSKASNATNQARQQQQMQNMQIRGQQLGSMFDIADKSGLLKPINNYVGGMVDRGLSSMFPQYGQQPIDQVPQAGGPMNYSYSPEPQQDLSTSYANTGMGPAPQNYPGFDPNALWLDNQ